MSYGGDTGSYIGLKHRVLGREEERALCDQLVAARKSGDKSTVKRVTDTLVRHNMRRFMLEARRTRIEGLTLEDRAQLAAVGFLRALEKFEPERGHRLSTYFRQWARASIQKGAENAAVIDIPAHLGQKRAKVKYAQAKVRTKTGREATVAELAKMTREPEHRIRTLLQVDVVQSMTHLDAEVGANREDSLVGFFRSDTPTPDEALALKQRALAARKVLGTLPERMREIVGARFSDDEPTLAAVGRVHGLSRERCRQIQNVAVHDLRSQLKAVTL